MMKLVSLNIFNIPCVQINFCNILHKAELKIIYKIKSKENIILSVLVYCTLASISFISSKSKSFIISKAISFSNNSPDHSSVFWEKKWRTLTYLIPLTFQVVLFQTENFKNLVFLKYFFSKVSTIFWVPNT